MLRVIMYGLNIPRILVNNTYMVLYVCGLCKCNAYDLSKVTSGFVWNFDATISYLIYIWRAKGVLFWLYGSSYTDLHRSTCIQI